MNKQAQSPNPLFWFLPLVPVIIGVLLLLHNYLLLEFNILQLWPVLLIVLGLYLLIRGELGLGAPGQNFGITRGSVEAATLRANSGELDVQIRALQREGRLIAGQYSAHSRPKLESEGGRAIVQMERGRKWMVSLTNWEIQLATDLPWNLLVSTFLGAVQVDLQRVIVERAQIATGIGDIHAVAPDNPSGPLTFKSTLGNIHLDVPNTIEAAVTITGSRLFDTHVLSSRWLADGPNRYVTSNFSEAVEPLDITASGTFGGLWLT